MEVESSQHLDRQTDTRMCLTSRHKGCTIGHGGRTGPVHHSNELVHLVLELAHTIGHLGHTQEPIPMMI
jgi:hypothetical protein